MAFLPGARLRALFFVTMLGFSPFEKKKRVM
jgi:hypothetical protein